MFQWTLKDEDGPWMRWALLAAMLFALFAIALQWKAIGQLALIDTDDNLRLAQVRDWMAGQGWYDLRQYRMEAPEGIDIHWSRLPDLPIAGMIWLLSPLLGAGLAEKIAAALAPLLPAFVIFLALAQVVRRAVSRGAWPIALVAVVMGTGLGSNLMPMRIDHHGWQLAMLALAMLGFTDPRPARGGAVMGLAIAGSLAIGLEMILFLALVAAATVVGWIFFVGERLRVMSLGVATAGAMGPAYLVFASDANRGVVCDALSTVWLSDALVGGALLVAIAWRAPHDWRVRLALATGAGLLLAAFHGLAFPHCLARLEGVSDEANRLWLSRVTEAKSILGQKPALIVRSLSLPLAGLVGYGLLARRGGGDGRRRMAVALGLAAAFAFVLMFWQARMAGAAQLLAIPGAAGLLVVLLPRLEASSRALVRVLGISLLFLLTTGALPVLVSSYLPGAREPAPSARGKTAKLGPQSGRQACGTPDSMATLAALPAGTVYTFLDMAPRLLVMTPHKTVTGPYHRNDDAIVANIKTLRSDAEDAHAALVAADADYLYLCKAQAAAIGRSGFAHDLVEGQRYDWLEPIDQGPKADAISLLFRLKE